MSCCRCAVCGLSIHFAAWFFDMAQNKFNEMASRLSKGTNGVPMSLKFLAAAGVAAYSVSKAMYTG